ncbi:MAG: patatin-like phospholipase family protein, partial [Paludibacteraceae bacterium]|nr:patatin-like phospholipase family protein [Paludibacteraceae bacterium]
ALEEHGIRPDVIAGTSAGSVVAALYSAGYKFINPPCSLNISLISVGLYPAE